jgi:hypothetical protein
MGLKAKHIDELNSLTAKPKRIAKRGFVDMLEEQLQEQHCEYTMLLVTKDIMDA